MKHLFTLIALLIASQTYCQTDTAKALRLSNKAANLILHDLEKGDVCCKNLDSCEADLSTERHKVKLYAEKASILQTANLNLEELYQAERKRRKWAVGGAIAVVIISLLTK